MYNVILCLYHVTKNSTQRNKRQERTDAPSEQTTQHVGNAGGTAECTRSRIAYPHTRTRAHAHAHALRQILPVSTQARISTRRHPRPPASRPHETNVNNSSLGTTAGSGLYPRGSPAWRASPRSGRRPRTHKGLPPSPSSQPTACHGRPAQSVRRGDLRSSNEGESKSEKKQISSHHYISVLAPTNTYRHIISYGRPVRGAVITYAYYRPFLCSRRQQCPESSHWQATRQA